MSSERIKLLPKEVYQQIKAGEVIREPRSVVKELLENSLDAGATSVEITLLNGGMDEIRVRDDGHGINSEDLPIVCEEHTTSKLRSFKDLRDMKTFGFRGEALSSMTHVGNVTITTKTERSPVAFVCEYSKGKMISQRRIAGNVGTCIQVKSLFYNQPLRRKNSKSSGFLQRVVQIVVPYAVHNHGVSISLRTVKVRKVRSYVQTQRNSSLEENIGVLYGSKVRVELENLHFRNEDFDFECVLRFTNPNYNVKVGKKNTFLLFINDRLVQCRNLKKCIFGAFQGILPEKTVPWVYCSLKLACETIDVNVSVTKEEVSYLHENEINSVIQENLRKKLASSNNSRTFSKVMRKTPIQQVIQIPKLSIREQKSNSRVYQKNKVRITGDDQRGQMERYVQVRKRPLSGQKFLPPTKKRRKSSFGSDVVNCLTSIKALRSKICGNSNLGKLQKSLQTILKSHTYVGFVNPELSLVQCSEKLYIVNSVVVSETLLYNFYLEGVGEFLKIEFKNPIVLNDLMRVALKSQTISFEFPIFSERIKKFLENDNLEFLRKYFMFDIREGKLFSVPQIIVNYNPPLNRLPDLFVDLVMRFDFDEEQSCFENVGKVFAKYFRLPCGGELVEPSDTVENVASRGVFTEKHLRWVTEQVIFPALKISKYLFPEDWCTNGVVNSIADLGDLYKVFERC